MSAGAPTHLSRSGSFPHRNPNSWTNLDARGNGLSGKGRLRSQAGAAGSALLVPRFVVAYRAGAGSGMIAMSYEIQTAALADASTFRRRQRSATAQRENSA